jgi:hypothetical protein
LARNADSRVELRVEEVPPQETRNLEPVCNSSLPISRQRERSKLELDGLTSYFSFNEETIFSKVGTYTVD